MVDCLFSFLSFVGSTVSAEACGVGSVCLLPSLSEDLEYDFRVAMQFARDKNKTFESALLAHNRPSVII